MQIVNDAASIRQYSVTPEVVLENANVASVEVVTLAGPESIVGVAGA